MNRLFIFIVVLFLGCAGHVYIGETEKEYWSKNNIQKKVYLEGNSYVRSKIKSGDSSFCYSKERGDSTQVYICRDGEIVIYYFENRCERLSIQCDKNGDTTFGYGKYHEEEFSNYLSKRHDSSIYIVPDKNKDIEYRSMLFINGICTSIDTEFKRIDVRYIPK